MLAAGLLSLLAGAAPGSAQLLPTTTTTRPFPTSAPTTAPATPTTAPAPTGTVPRITVATNPPTTAARRSATTTSEPTGTTTTGAATTQPPPPPTTAVGAPPTTAPFTLPTAEPASYSWLPLLVTLAGFGTAIGILAFPLLAHRARNRPPPTGRPLFSAPLSPDGDPNRAENEVGEEINSRS